MHPIMEVDHERIEMNSQLFLRWCTVIEQVHEHRLATTDSTIHVYGSRCISTATTITIHIVIIIIIHIICCIGRIIIIIVII